MTDLPASSEDKLAESLRGLDSAEYGPAYRDHALEIYKTYLELTDRISQRREKANSFFLAVNAALIALLANDAFGGSGPAGGLEILIPVTGVVLSYLWYRLIRSYRDLNSAKFKVVHEMERQLPLRPFDAEWESVGRGKDPKLYLPFTRVERAVPWLFLLLHAVITASLVPWNTLFGALRGAG